MSDYDRPITRKPILGSKESYQQAEQGALNPELKREMLADKDLTRIFEPAAPPPSLMTLPTDSQERKGYPLYRGCLKYFPAALAGVSRISKAGNDKHNPGEEMHHARGKSSDHGDCILRHLIDVTDLIARRERNQLVSNEEILNEVNQLAWRVLAFSQELHESLGAPLAPGARLTK